MKAATTFILLLLTLWTTIQGQDYFFRQYSNEEGLNHPFVYAINQDMDGYLWIGTGEGLYRFDGFDFKYFTTKEGLGDDFVTKIFRDSSGILWLGHQSGLISTISGNGINVINQHSEVQGTVAEITQDARGDIWVAVQNQDLLIINAERVPRRIGFPVEQDPISHIECLEGGNFLIGSQENLYLSHYRQGTDSMTVIERITKWPGSKVVDIFPESAGTYIVVSLEDGIYRFTFNSHSASYSFSAIDNNPDGMLDNLQGGIIDGRGTLWLNSLGSGLIHYRKNQRQEFTRTGRVSVLNGLVSENVRSVFEDSEGNLWLGMYGDGLLRHVDNHLRFYSYSSEAESNSVFAVTGDDSKLMAVIGDSLFKITLTGEDKLASNPLPESLSDDRVNTAFLDGNGRLWLGFEQSGLYVAGPAGFRFTAVDITDDELANSVNHITGHADMIWASTKRGICRIHAETGHIKWFTTDQGLPHNNIQQSYIDSKNRVLVATLCSEIYYINADEKVIKLENSRIGPFGSVMSFAEDRTGTIWAGTEGNGVWRIAESENINYSRNSGLLSDFCYSLTQSADGELVVGHRGGISRIDPVSKRIRTFSQLEGIKSATELYHNAVFGDPLGQIWLGTSDGLIKYTSNISSGGLAAPRLQIGALYIDGEKVNHGTGQVSLKPGYYEVAVEYIGIHLTNPEMVQYQTKMEGYNKNWSDLTSERRVVYDRVGHGEYTFMLKAFNENNIESEISSGIGLKIKKPAYRTLWFNAILIVLVFALVSTIIWLRERNLRTEQERLLRKIDEKTKDLIVKEEIIKERKKVEKVLIEAKTKAEMSEKLKTSFLQNMSHEIRTPMNAVVGFSELLMKNTQVDEKQTEYINVIHSNAENLLSIIDDILDVSQLETNQLKVKQVNCKLDVIIDGLKGKYLEMLKYAGKDDIVLTTRVGGNKGLEIQTDPARLEQVLRKLLDNAVKFTESGSITFGYEQDGENITFFVEDTGIGLSEDKAGIIFDLFRKVEDDKVKLYGGTGLGLALARYLVQLMGGKIDVESTENVGSRFYFVLPYIPVAGKPDILKSIAPTGNFEGSWPGKRVLVVEDTDSNYKLINKLLEPTGMAIERASNGEIAMDKYFGDGSFDLIIMDIKLPGRDGYQITRKIRERDKHVPIISYTAYALEGDREKSIEAGCNEYFAKPADSLSMLQTIDGLINRNDKPGEDLT